MAHKASHAVTAPVASRTATRSMTLENAPGGTEQVDYFMRKDLKRTAAE